MSLEQARLGRRRIIFWLLRDVLEELGSGKIVKPAGRNRLLTLAKAAQHVGTEGKVDALLIMFNEPEIGVHGHVPRSSSDARVDGYCSAQRRTGLHAGEDAVRDHMAAAKQGRRTKGA